MKEVIIPDFKVRGLWSKGTTIDKDLFGRTRAGSLWKCINSRCKKYKSVNNFHNFQTFAEYIQGLDHLMSKEPNGKFWQIDKDFNLYGDRSYCESNILFLPNEINSFITSMSKIRDLPLGVTYIDRSDGGNLKGLSKPYRASCKDRVSGAGTTYLEYFATPEEAHFAWIKHKKLLLETKMSKPHLIGYIRFEHFAQEWLDAFTYHINNKIIFNRIP